MTDTVSQMLESFLAMYTAGPQNNIHIPVTIHVRHHQFSIFDSRTFKVEVHDIDSTRICQLPEPVSGKLIYIKTVYVNQTDIRFAITVIIHRDHSIGIQCFVVRLIQCKVETFSVVNSLSAIQVDQ